MLDLATDEGRSAARRLALVERRRRRELPPGADGSFGLGYADLAEASDRTSSTARSPRSARRKDSASRPGYDIIVQALSGLMSFTGHPGGEPTKVGVALLDVICGLYAANGIQAALLGRARTGRGARITVSLFDASVAALVNQAANHLLGGTVPEPMGNQHPNIVPYQLFETADRPIILAAGNDRLFARTCEVLGRADLAGDERFATNEARGCATAAELIPMLQDDVPRATGRTEWIATLEAAAVPCAPVRRVDEVFASPEGAALVQQVEDPERGVLRLVAVADPRGRARRRRRAGHHRATASTPTRSSPSSSRDPAGLLPRSIATARGGRRSHARRSRRGRGRPSGTRGPS